MKKLKVTIISFIYIFVLVSACQSRTPALTPVISDPTCEPPCWANIHPGKTTEMDVENILRDNPSVKDDSIYKRPLEGFEGMIWNFKDGSDGQVRFKNGVVWSLGFASPINGSVNITLEQAIKKYGEPEYVFSRFVPVVPNWGAITFLYPKKGITYSYSSHVERNKYQGILRPETPITSISYFPPENYQEIYDKSFINPPDWTAEIVKASIYPWNGYGNISEKYPTAYGKQ
jgi:hypothetical protein